MTTPMPPATQALHDPTEVEQLIEDGLEALRHAPLNERIIAALKFLAPEGYRPAVQIEQLGPKKRGAPVDWNWNPERTRIVVQYERLDSNFPAPTHSPIPAHQSPSLPRTQPEPPPSSVWVTREAAEEMTTGELLEVTPLQIQQCCEALAQAEKAGKAFIAFKWFRDDALPKHRYDWATSPELRQRVLAKAIDIGAIRSERIKNPKAPQHPTATVALNRVEMPLGVKQRFNPIVVSGEPLSVSMMRDRGDI